jgi:hypothetical protein
MLLNKNLWFIVVMIGINLSLFSSDAFGERLVTFYTSEDGSKFYYDKDSVKRKSGNVKVWSTERWKGEKLSDYKKSLRNASPTKNVENFSYTKTLHEIDCEEGRYRFLTTAYYDVEGKVLYTIPEQVTWAYIVPGSVHDALKSSVCK